MSDPVRHSLPAEEPPVTYSGCKREAHGYATVQRIVKKELVERVPRLAAQSQRHVWSNVSSEPLDSAIVVYSVVVQRDKYGLWVVLEGEGTEGLGACAPVLVQKNKRERSVEFKDVWGDLDGGCCGRLLSAPGQYSCLALFSLH